MYMAKGYTYIGTPLAITKMSIIMHCTCSAELFKNKKIVIQNLNSVGETVIKILYKNFPIT